MLQIMPLWGEIEAENVQNAQRMQFCQKGPGCNGLNHGKLPQPSHCVLHTVETLYLKACVGHCVYIYQENTVMCLVGYSMAYCSKTLHN